MGLYVNSKYVSMVFIFCSGCDCWAVFRIFVPGCHEVNDVFREAVMRRSFVWDLHSLDTFLRCVLLARFYNSGEFHALQSEKQQAGYTLY